MVQFPLVSIITPSFNQGQFLEDTILSVLNQDYPNFEYIIIDGGSIDNSVEIIKKYKHRINYWISEKDEGQTHAILKGIEKAKGEFFTWLCSDDLLEPSMLRISVGFMEKFPNAGLTFGDRVRIDAKGNIYSLSRFFPVSLKSLKWNYSIPQETVLIRKSAYDKTSGLKKELQMAMDFDLWCKLAKITEFCHIPTYLGRFRAHATNKSTLYTKQINDMGFQGNFTSEFSEVYFDHFRESPSAWRFSAAKKFEPFKGILYRKANHYRENFLFANQLRHS